MSLQRTRPSLSDPLMQTRVSVGGGGYCPRRWMRARGLSRNRATLSQSGPSPPVAPCPPMCSTLAKCLRAGFLSPVREAGPSEPRRAEAPSCPRPSVCHPSGGRPLSTTLFCIMGRECPIRGPFGWLRGSVLFVHCEARSVSFSALARGKHR